MKRFSEQLKKKSDSIRLRAAEKRDLRERLEAYMEYHPMSSTTSTKVRTTATPVTTETFHVLHISRWFVRGLGGVMALFLILIPVLAERSVPGDSLYAVKVKVNEEVWSSLAFSPFEKIEWETKRLERRIAEAQVLARSGRLTPEAEALVVDAVEEHRLSAAASIEQLRSVDAEQASLAEMTLSAVLDVQSAKLSSNNVASSTTGRSTAALAQAVAVSQEAAEMRSANADISYERLMARIEQETTRTYELLDSIRGNASAEQVQAVERRLRDVERALASVVSARIAIETNDAVPVTAVSIDVATTTNAASSTITTTVVSNTTEQVIASEDDLINELRSTFKALQKLIAYMTDIDLQATVQIETLVPVVLTDEEAHSEVTAQQRRLAQQITQIEQAIPVLSNASTQEKIRISIQTVERLLADSEAASNASSWSTARANLAEAEAFVQSMQRIFSLEDISLSNLTPRLSTDTTTAATTTVDSANTDAATTTDNVSEERE